MHSYEVEIKSLLGSAERAQSLKDKMRDIDPRYHKTAQSSQLNHYFHTGNLQELNATLKPYFDDRDVSRLSSVIESGKDVSVRTRQADDRVLFVLKASVDATTSQNGIARIEIEREIPVSLEELDRMILSAGFSYQAKWSREREEYLVRGTTVTIDRNAGYGYLAEFEKVVTEMQELASAESEIRELMKSLDVEELTQERLARMFAYYNEHWQEYYGTEAIFTIH